MKKNNSRQLAIWALVIALTATTIAYAVLQTSLSISGNVTRKGGTWSIKLDNIANKKTTGQASFVTDPKVGSDGNITFAATLSQPGDSFEFTFDVINAGTVDAVSRFSESQYDFWLDGGDGYSSSSEVDLTSSDITCKVTYNGEIITSNNRSKIDLPKPTSTSNPTRKTLKAYCQYDDASSISSNEVELRFELTLPYEQA